MFDLISIIIAAGYLGIFLIIFAESGLFIGFFFPGDSLLFTAGFLASQGYLNIVWLMALSFTGAVLGDSFGYYFGRKIGPRIFKREDSIIFSRDHLIRAEKFYESHGSKTIVLARFIPIVRTFAPILAGVGKMRYPRFIFYNLIGGFIWGACIPALGFYLGSAIPGIDRYLIPIIILIIFTSLIPSFVHLARDSEHRHRVFMATKKFLHLA